MLSKELAKTVVLSLVLLSSVVGCEPKDTEPGTTTAEEGSTEEGPTIEEAQEILQEAARAERAALPDTFEEFKASVYQEPFEGGKFVVNGDTTIIDEKHLREFYDDLRTLDARGQAALVPLDSQALIVHVAGGLDAVWNSEAKNDLTYCVSSTFGGRYDTVVAEMNAAADAWEAAADVDLRHDPDHDDDCTRFNGDVVFDVRPVDVNGQYLARAFFPNEPRSGRNVLIDESSFDLGGGNLTLTGILRHELGHALGFRHEHTRPNSGTCFEDSNWRPLGDYDPFSVMHYPQCNGLGDWSLTLTDRDRNGAACLYGAAAGFAFDPSLVSDPDDCAATVEPDGGEPVTQTFADQSVARDERQAYGPFAVVAGSIFDAGITGSGDPDLYVRFGSEPTLERYNCRPFLFGAEEACSIDVPPGAAQAHVMVHGWEDGRYDLTVTHTPPGE